MNKYEKDEISCLPSKYRPMTVWSYIGYNLLFGLPVIALTLWDFSHSFGMTARAQNDKKVRGDRVQPYSGNGIASLMEFIICSIIPVPISTPIMIPIIIIMISVNARTTRLKHEGVSVTPSVSRGPVWVCALFVEILRLRIRSAQNDG